VPNLFHSYLKQSSVKVAGNRAGCESLSPLLPPRTELSAVSASGFALGMRGETKTSSGYGVALYASSLAGTATGV
jgi:hypothetical protein